MSDDNDNSDKTEEPTQKRISDAVKKGQVANSREVSNFMMLLVLALNIAWFAPYYFKESAGYLMRFLTNPHDIIVDSGNLPTLAAEIFSAVGFLMLLPIVATIFAALFSSFVQNGIVISGESIMPKLEKISVFKGLKRLFSMRSLMEFVKGIIKITIIGATSYIVVQSELDRLEQLTSQSIGGVIALLAELALKIVVFACAIMLVIAVMDFLYQKYEYLKSLKMSRQELKDEYKQSEGDPQIKGKIRQIRMERAKNRMMAQVPEADVVIRNPTHYAIALKYDDTMGAPKVLAKGQGFVALAIIDIAEEHQIITVTNKPLARALYDSATVDEEIPLDHYQAVAEVIGYVYKMKGKKK